MPTLPPEILKSRCPWKARACVAALASLALNQVGFAQTVLIDFGNSSTYRGVTTPGNWNSVGFGYTGNLIDTNGAATTIDYAPDGLGGTDSFNSIVGTTSNPPTAVQISNAQSAVSGSLGSLAAGEAAIDFFRSDNGTTGVGRFQLQQAVTGLTYDLTFYGSKQYVNASNTQTKYSVFNDSSYSSLLSSGTLTTGTTGGAGNPSSTVTLVGLAAPTNANAIFYIQWEGLSNSTFGYINSMSVSGYAAYGGGGATNISTAKTYNAPTFITNGTTVNAEVAGALPTNAPTALTISGAGSTLNASANQTIASLSGGAGTTIAVSNGASFTVANADASSHAGVLAGSGTLLKTNSGSLTLSASNSFSGTATVAGGTLTVGNVNALRNATLDTGSSGSQTVTLGLAGNNTYNLGGLAGADNLALDGNSLNVGGTVATTYSGALSGTGSLVKSGTGTLALSGANTHSGGTIISAGRLNVDNASALGSGTLILSNGASFNNTSGGAISNINNNAISFGGTNTFAGSSSLDLGSGNVTLNEATRLNVSSGDLTLRGTVSGSAGFNKDGIGTLTLAGSNAMTSYTVLDYGVLNLANTDALANAQLYLYGSSSNRMVVFGAAGTNTYRIGALSSSGTGTLTLGTNSVDVGRANQNTTFSGVVEGSGLLAKSGSGTFTLSGANTHSGGTTLSGGQLNINNASALGTGAFTLGNGASFDNTSGGALTNTQNNAVSLAGTNTFLGSSSLNLGTGTVTLGGNSQLNVTGGLRLGGNISGSSTLTKAGTGTLTLAGTNFGSSQLVVSSGTLTLTDANRNGWTNNTGAFRLEGGTLSLVNGNNLGGASAGGVQVQFAANSTLRFDGSGTLLANRGFAISNGVTATIDSQGFTPTMSNAVQGGGAVNKIGAGALSLAGANTHSGGTTLSAGQLNINNASALGTGTFTLANGTTFDNTSAAAITNTQNNAIVLGSTNTFAGTRDLHLGNGNVTFSGNTRLNVNSNNLTLGGNLSGSSAFNKDGIGTLTLAGSNAMTSFTVLDYGILNLGNVNALANAQLYLYGSGSNKMVTFGVAGSNTYNLGALSGAADGTLSLGANSLSVGAGNLTTTFSGVIEGTGALTKSGTGTFTLSGANTHSGGTTLSAGQLNINNASALGTGTFAVGGGVTFDNTSGGAISNANNNAVTFAGTNVFTGSSSMDLGTGAVIFSGNTRLNVNGGSLTLGGTITGADVFSKDGIGTLTLSGSNAMTSFTVVDYGTLNLAHTNALANAQLYLYDSGSNKMVTFGVGGTNTYNIGALSGASDAILTLGANSIDIGAANTATTYAGAIEGTGGLTKTGTSTLTLSGFNSYTGATRISAGTVSVASGGSLGNGTDAFVSSGALLDVQSSTSVGSIQENGVSDGGSVNIGSGATLTVDGANKGTLYQNTVTGAGNLTLAASGNTVLTLYGDNTLSGNVSITGGTLAASGAGSNQALKSVAGLTIGSSATLLIGSSNQVNNSASVTLSGGTIQRASGASEIFGNLNLTAPSSLDFGTGAAGNLTFGTYQNNETPSALLTLNNFVPGNSFTFNSGSFTAGNINSYFSFGTGFVDYSLGNTGSTFTITAIPEPSSVVAAAGLLACMAWSARRRVLGAARRALH